jgi:hypothetical protein
MGQGAKAPCLNMGRKQYTGQEMLTKLRLDTAVVDDVRIFQLMGPASKSPLLEKKYAVQTKDPDKLLTVDEMWRAYRRLVMCARILEDTADEDLQVLYDQKFGKGDGL